MKTSMLIMVIIDDDENADDVENRDDGDDRKGKNGRNQEKSEDCKVYDDDVTLRDVISSGHRQIDGWMMLVRWKTRGMKSSVRGDAADDEATMTMLMVMMKRLRWW